ncbi:MAG: thiamine phosphate synthase [Pseudomonadota bacterium]
MTRSPQLYLVLPPRTGADAAAYLARQIARHPPACVRLGTAGLGEDEIRKQADAVREIAHRAEIAVVIESHFRLVRPLGLDGVHLTDGHRNIRAARKELGADAIIGTFCGASRHIAMTAAEMGADYVAIGPFTAGGLGDGATADPALAAWWSEMIETPLVVEGGLSTRLAASLANAADFIAMGAELWGAEILGAEPQSPEDHTLKRLNAETAAWLSYAGLFDNTPDEEDVQ